MTMQVGSPMVTLPLTTSSQTDLAGQAKTDAGNKTKSVVTRESDAFKRKREEAEKAAQEFETLFVDMMVKSMRQTAQPEEMSNAEDIYQGMLDSEYSKAMTTSNNFGIREQILNWMEQTDPSLKKTPNTSEASKADGAKEKDVSLDSIKIQNEMWALKAASQAYQLSGQPR